VGTVQRVLRELYDEENGVPREEIVREAVWEGVPATTRRTLWTNSNDAVRSHNSDPKNNLLKPTPTR